MQLAVIIPTRNRAELALAAARSALTCESSDLVVSVSDNSTGDEQSRELHRACSDLGDARLSYLRCPESMSMTDHWNWALEEILHSGSVTHVVFLCDRWLFYPDAIVELMRVVADHPTEVISYSWDTVEDFDRPVRVLQRAWSGHLLEVSFERLLELAAAPEGWNDAWQTVMPRPLNSVVPVRTLEAVRDRFGAAFGSLAPDYCFAFRCLAVVDSVLHYDKTCMIDYALDRSAGANYQSGGSSAELANFFKESASTGMNFASPIPEVHTAWNTIFHEYCYVRREADSTRFKPLDRQRYMESLAWSLGFVRDAGLRSAGYELLRAHGWVGDESPVKAVSKSPLHHRLARALAHPSVALAWARTTVGNWRTGWPQTRWPKPFRLAFSLASVRPADAYHFRFRSTRSALGYALKVRRPSSPSPEHLKSLNPRTVLASATSA